MAISTQDINLVKRKVFAFLENGTTRGRGNVFAREQFKALFSYFSQHGSNPNLQFVTFADLTGDTVIADAAHKLYAVFVKKQNTGTDAFVKGVDHATVAAGTTFAFCIELNLGNDVACLIFPAGLAMATGLTLVSSTTDTGGTDSTSGDGPNGFILLGDA